MLLTYMKKQILVVDDEPSILKLLNFILSSDYEVVVKPNGAEAISWLEEGNDPALIISDLEMPLIDGESLIRNLRISDFYRKTPIILLSGADDLEIKVEKMAYRADRFIKKPFNPAELKSTIAASLN